MERLAIGQAHEQRVADELEQRGWTVTQWGQSILAEQIKSAIRQTGSRFRHFPDLVAARGCEIATIDAKDSMPSAESGRYAVAQKCTHFGLQFDALFGLPVYYVFGNLGVLCPSEVMSYGRLEPHAPRGAYYLVNGRQAHIFDDVFGPPPAVISAAFAA